MRCAFVPTVFLVLFTESARRSYCVRAKLKCVRVELFGPCPCSVSSVFMFHVIRIYFANEYRNEPLKSIISKRLIFDVAINYRNS